MVGKVTIGKPGVSIIDFVKGATYDDLVKLLLPNLDKIPGLVIEVNGLVILEPVGDLEALYNTLHIALIPYTESLDIPDNISKTCAFIIEADTIEHYVTLVINLEHNAIIFMDSLNKTGGLLAYPEICKQFRDILDIHKVQAVSVPMQNGANSLCHAYLNAVMVLALVPTCRIQTQFLEDVRSMINDPLVSATNANCMLSYLLLHSDSDDVVEYIDEDEARLERKEFVNKQIKEFVKEQYSLDQVKSFIKENNILFSQREDIYITNTYARCCFREFIAETNCYLVQHISEISTNLLPFLSLLDAIQVITDIGAPFDQVRHYSMFLKYGQLFKENDQLKLVAEFKQNCWACLKKEVSSLQTKIEFVRELEKCLKNSFLQYDMTVISDSITVDTDKNTILRLLLDELEHTRNPLLYELKVIAKQLELQNNTDELLSYLVKTVIDDYLTPVSVKLFKRYDRMYVECQGRYLDLQDTLKAIDTKVERPFEEVRIIAKQILRANSNIELPGKNLIIIAPEIDVCDDLVWDVSGEDAKQHREHSADDGDCPGADGYAGLNGEHGESGGNVLILSDVIHNAEDLDLTIMSNGGKGAKGQHGGNGQPGKDGKDGKGLSKEAFKEKFPDSASLFGVNAGSGYSKFFENISEIITENPELSTKANRGRDDFLILLKEATPREYYCEMTTNDGNRSIYSHYTASSLLSPLGLVGYPVRTAFCIHYGTDGTPGQPGGDGGRGGEAGQGGYAGKVDVKGLTTSLEARFYTEHNEGESGQDGHNGKGARGGKNGEKAVDNARVEPQQYRSTRYFHGRLKLKYESSSSSENAWCPKENKYATVEYTSSKQSIRQAHGEDGENQRQKRRQHLSERRHKVPILSEKIREKYQSVLQAKKLDTGFSDVHLSRLKDAAQDGIKHSASSVATRLHHHQIHTTLCSAEEEIEKEKMHCIYIPSEFKAKKHADLSVLNYATERSTNTDTMQKILRQFNTTKTVQECIEQFQSLIAYMKNETVSLSDGGYILRSIMTTFSDNDGNKLLSKSDISHLLDYIAELMKNEILKSSIVPNLTSNQKQKEEMKQDLQKVIEKTQKTLLVKYKYAVLEDTSTDIETITERWTNENKEDLAGNKRIELNNLICTTVSRVTRDLIYGMGCQQERKNIDDFADQTTVRLGEVLDELLNELYAENNLISLLDCPTAFVLPDVDQYATESDEEDPDPDTESDEEDRSPDTESDEEDRYPDTESDEEDRYPDTESDEENRSPDTNSAELTEREVKIREHFLKQVTRLPREFGQYLTKLQYLTVSGSEILLEMITQRIGNEAIQIPIDIFQWLISRVIFDAVNHGIDSFVAIIATKPQQTWLGQYILLQLQRHILVSFLDSVQLRRKLIQFSNYNFMLFFSQRLAEMEQGSTVSILAVTKILSLAENIELDENVIDELQSVNISDWPYRIRWLVLLLSVKCLSATDEWKSIEIIEATSYLSYLENKFGSRLVDKIIVALRRCPGLVVKHILVLLKNFYSNHWKIDSSSLETVSERPSAEWSALLSKHLSRDTRSLSDLIGLIRDDSNKTLTTIDLSQVKYVVNRIRCLCSSENISTYSEDDIKKWVEIWKVSHSLNAENIEESLVEIIAVISRAVRLKMGFYLRVTQLLSVILFLRNTQKGLLQQIATGEGKSLIIVALAIVKAMTGQKVDIITSSSVLAKRDAELYRPLYELFGFKVAHNCSEDIDTRKEAYMSCVVYGDIGGFQRDILLTGFYDENVLGDRRNDTVIVDEVDSMLLDKGQNVLYLSHNIPGLDALEHVYVYIWNYVHAAGVIGTEEDVRTIQEGMTDMMYGIIRKKEITTTVFGEETQQTVAYTETLWQNLVTHNVIKDNGQILVREQLLQNKLSLDIDCSTLSYSPEQAQRVLSVLKDAIRRGNVFPVPKHLDEFINRHIGVWIGNAFKAKYLQLNEHYIIDIDRSETGQGKSANIIIMDNDTGVEQYHTQWNQGLHQFLQLKHGCRLSFESLKAVFMSNVAFFKRYEERLYGLTGTLGSTVERTLLKQLYEVDYITLPTYRPSQFVEEESIVCQDEKEWIDSVIEVSRHIAKTRPVLIICKSVKDVVALEKALSLDQSVFVYKHSYKPLEVGTSKPIDTGLIILATNLAGRGTDLKISDTISEIGGVHVCLTYMPPNIRIEEQAFGRAARKGQKGSGQLIVVGQMVEKQTISAWQKILQLKVQRDKEEHYRIGCLKEHYHSFIEVEEKLFANFQAEYSTLRRALTGVDGKQTAIMLTTFLDEWAFSLDSIGNILANGHSSEKQNKISLINQSLTIYRQDLEKIRDFLSMPTSFIDKVSNILVKSVDVAPRTALSYLDPSTFQPPKSIKRQAEKCFMNKPAQCIKLAKTFVANNNIARALELFDLVIKADTGCCEVAHYYTAFCQIKNNELDKPGVMQEFVRHLRKAEELIRHRMDLLSSSSSLIALISEQYEKHQDSFLVTDDYKQQKKDMLDLYGLFMQSIQDILGRDVSAAMLQIGSIDLCCSNYIYDQLLSLGILRHPHLTIDFPDQPTWNNLYDCYQLYSQELKVRLEKLREEQCHISAESFKNVLPSREELWNVLIKSEALVDDEDYVILDTRELDENKNVNSDVREKLLLFKTCDDFGTFRRTGEDADTRMISVDGQVCMFPEQIKRIEEEVLVVIPYKNFQEVFGGFGMWQALFESNILLCNTKAAINDPETLQSLRIGKYDCINMHTFSEIQGVNESASEKIFTLLQNAKILSLDKPAKLLKSSIASVRLPGYEQYQTEIVNVIIKHFQYRLALEELQENGRTDLPSKPHEELFADLVRKHIIQTATVNDDMTDEVIREKMKMLTKQVQSEKVKSKIQTFSKQILSVEYIVYRMFFPVLLEKAVFLPGMQFGVDTTVKRSSDNTPTVESVDIQQLSDCLLAWKQGLSKYEVADANLVELIEALDADKIFNSLEELNVFTQNGFGEIISLCEKKWTFQAIRNMAAIVCLGVAQILLGVAIEIFTVGAGTMIASGLIGEGFGDIMFAMECAYTGYCTWKAYKQHKIISLCITVLTAGVGVIFSRGAKYSRFGYKIMGEVSAHRNLVGKQLIKKVGMDRLLREVGVRVAKKITEATALGLANAAVDYAIQNMLKQSLNSVSRDIIGNIESHIDKHEGLKKSLGELFEMCAEEDRKVIIDKINLEVFGRPNESEEFLNKLTSNISQVAGALAGGFGQAVTKLSRTSSGNRNVQILSKLLSACSSVMKYGMYTKAIAGIINTVDDGLSKMERKLQIEIENLKQKHGSCSHTSRKDGGEFEEFLLVVRSRWKNTLTKKVEEKLTNELVRPVMRSVAHTLVHYGSIGIKKAYHKYQNAKLRTRFEDIKRNFDERNKELIEASIDSDLNNHHTESLRQRVENEYHKELTILLKETRNPTLFADIIREGVPVGIHCVQSVAEVLGRPIKIVTADNRFEQFEPSGGRRSDEAIIVYYTVREGETVGHFSTTKSIPGTRDGPTPETHNCLFDAISEHTPINRDQIANEIESNELIKDRIRRGLHRHHMENLFVGGRVPTKKSVEIKKQLIHDPDMSEKDKKRKLTDKSGKSDGATRGTGNDELLQRRYVEEWAKRSKDPSQRSELTLNGQSENLYFHDLHVGLRVDNKFVVWLNADTGTLEGHPGALYSHRDPVSGVLQHGTSKGQHAFHNKRTEQIWCTSNAQDAAKTALVEHLNLTAHPEQIINYNGEKRYSTHGHDLSDATQCKEFARGLGLERYKIYGVATALNGGKPPSGVIYQPQRLNNSDYKSVDQRIKNATNKNDLFNILKDPASFNYQ